MIRSLCAVFLLAGSLSWAEDKIENVDSKSPRANQIKVSTFNVKWFGRLNPTSQTPVKDQIAYNKARSAELKKFLNSELASNDVIAFQEIVDTKGLASLLPPGWSCSTYTHQNINHQHVMVCVGAKFSLTTVPYDQNNLIEEVAFDPERARPAVRVDIYGPNKKKLLRIVAVHLKASPEFSEVRESQVESIGNDILQSKTELPVVVLGDFNTYPKEKTEREENDEVIFEKVLKQSNPTLKRVDLKKLNTFRSLRSTGQFDQIYFSKGVKTVSAPRVFPVCNATQDGSGYMNHKFYVDMISDHCPVTVTLGL